MAGKQDDLWNHGCKLPREVYQTLVLLGFDNRVTIVGEVAVAIAVFWGMWSSCSEEEAGIQKAIPSDRRIGSYSTQG